jgi:capsular polysaccharide biosynthesis protein
VTSEDFLAALRLRWLAAMNLVALGLALAGLFTLFEPVQYQSQVQLYAVAVNRQITSKDLYNSALMAQDRVPVYAQLVRTPRVLDPAIAELGLQASSPDVARRITVSYEDGAAVMRIVVSDARPAGAKALADAIAVNLADVVQELERGGQQTGAVELRIVSEGTFPTLPTTPRRLVNILIGFGAGVVTALAVLLVTATYLYLQRRRTESLWAYLDIDGELKLALVHLVEGSGEVDDAQQGTVQVSVEPLQGTAPLTVTYELAEDQS